MRYFKAGEALGIEELVTVFTITQINKRLRALLIGLMYRNNIYFL